MIIKFYDADIRLWCVLGTQRLKTLQVMVSLIRLWQELLQVIKLIVLELSHLFCDNLQIFFIAIALVLQINSSTTFMI